MIEKLSSIESVIVENAQPIYGKKDLSSLVSELAKTKIVMLGESSHGTQEFYEWRRLISEELITKHDFNFIAVEGDWPPSAELNRYIHSQTRKQIAAGALAHFKRWPTWMWSNTEIMKLAQWMKSYNELQLQKHKVSFYGLDVYSLFESMDEVLKKLRKIDPALAKEARARYECFASFERDERAYARSLKFSPEGCKKEVLETLEALLEKRLEDMNGFGHDLFDIQQNARIAKNAEDYYRAMILGDDDSWNVRDRHMIETLEILMNQYGPNAKGIVWAHNTHIGDYRATDMVIDGQINIGGLAREKWGKENISLLGFGTYEGEVIAARGWDAPMQIMPVPPGRAGSYEAHFHAAAKKLEKNNFYLWFKDDPDPKLRELAQELGHRAIGVVYNPAFERLGNYVPTSLINRYDGFIFVDKTTALTPFIQEFETNEISETYPTGF